MGNRFSLTRRGTFDDRKGTWFSILLLVSLAILQNSCAGLVASPPSSGGPQNLTISNASASSVTQTSATVIWQTNLPATSQIEYGTSTSYGVTTALDSSLVSNHQQSMSSLNSGTLYHFRVHSRDANNTEAVSGDMTVTTASAPDTTAPTVSVGSPAANATLSGTVSVTATATDNVGVASVQFQLDGANLGSLDTASPYSTSWNTTTTSNGSHTLRAIAKDAAGNSTTSASVTVTVSNAADTTAPSVPANLAATAVSSSQISLNWSASTDNVGVTGYKIFRDSSQISTTGSLSYLDSGLAASTSYTYKVAAYDAAGNTSAQSAGASATTFASSGGGIPSTLGWFQIPNSAYNNVPIACSPGCDSALNGVEGLAGIVNAWGGGMADTTRDWLLVTGGGHKAYYGNQIYRLNLRTLTMDILKQPFPGPIPSCTESYSDGTPSAKHTYNGLQYAKNQDRYFAWGAGLPDCGFFGFSNWTFNPTTLTWRNLNPANAPGNASGSYPQTAYDPATGQIFSQQRNASKFLGYNFETNTWTLLKSSGLSGSCDLSYMAAAVDPIRNDYVCAGGGRIAKIHLAAPYTVTTLTGLGCSALTSASAPGWDWDSSQSKFVGWAGGDTVYIYNPTTDSCTTQTFAGGPGTQAGTGTFGRWRYFPNLNVFALVNRSGQNAYALRLTSGGGTLPPPADTTPPAVSITAPVSGSTVSGTVSVSASASDNISVAGVQFKLDGQNLGAEETAAPYSVSWDTTGTSNGSHTLTAVARDVAGNTSTAPSATVTVNNAAPPPPGGAERNLSVRCADPAVTLCYGMDQATQIAPYISAAQTIPQLDPTTKTSSTAGSLKFTIPQTGTAGSAGFWSRDMGRDFGEGQTAYISFRWRGDTALVNTDYGGDGWKMHIFWSGVGASCQDLQMVTQNVFHRRYPQMYRSCGSLPEFGFEVLLADGDHAQQFGTDTPVPGIGPADGYYCTRRKDGPGESNCSFYQANNWMTFYYKISIGNWNLPNSTVDAWVAYEGQAMKKWMSRSGITIPNDNPTTKKLRQMDLLPYITGRSSTVASDAFIWYSEVIVSGNPIPPPTGPDPQ